MKHRALVGLTVLLFALPLAGLGLRATSGDDDHGKRNTTNHPAVGSYFGRATQVCAPGAPCPQIALFMTPTLTGDGIFIGSERCTADEHRGQAGADDAASRVLECFAHYVSSQRSRGECEATADAVGSSRRAP
jgi:hypothetical protein